MKIYTKTGDRGKTMLLDGNVVDKNDARIEVNGCLDELNTRIGLLRDSDMDPEINLEFIALQKAIFEISATLAVDRSGESARFDAAQWDILVEAMENRIDQWTEVLPPLTHFIIPGGHPKVGLVHLARTCCRTAERRLVGLDQLAEIPWQTVVFINRLSDYLFVWARMVGLREGADETLWISNP